MVTGERERPRPQTAGAAGAGGAVLGAAAAGVDPAVPVPLDRTRRIYRCPHWRRVRSPAGRAEAAGSARRVGPARRAGSADHPARRPAGGCGVVGR
ncbi:MAG: hypothetical protein V7637_6338 [Mycobacteriales bacterium]